jgi:cytoskeletal protein RodZ
MQDVMDQPFVESLGERLRRERERRHIDLRSIAENTKISFTLLEALERNDASRWPSGIFRKSFVRSYAAAIGVDPDATAREFLERFPDPNDLERTAQQPPVEPTAPPAGFWSRLANARQFFTRPWIVQVRIARRQ